MAGFDANFFNSLPKIASPPPTSSVSQNPLVAGLASGVLGLGGSLAGFGGAVGRATGITPLAEGGEDWARKLGAASEAAGLPQYEQNPWSISGMGYQVAKAVPTLAAFMAGGELLAPAEAPAALAVLGRVAPRLLGGAGGAVGEVAEKAGAEWARHLVGGGLAGYPLMAGGAYQEQLANGGPDQGKAALALGVGAPEAAVGAIMPTQLRGLAEKGLAGDVAKRVLTGGAAAGATNMLQAGVQGALNQPFADPNTSFADRAKGIIQSALLGGAVGGLFGGAGAALGGKHGPLETPAQPEEPTQGPPVRPPSIPAGPYAFNQSPDYAPNPHFAGDQGEMFGGVNAAIAHAPYPANEAGQLDLFQNGPQPGIPNPPPIGHQYELPGIGRPSPGQGGASEAQVQGPHDMGLQFPGFDTVGEAPAPLPGLDVPHQFAVRDANLLERLRSGTATEGERALADRTGVTALHGTPRDMLDPVQQARYDAAHLLTTQGAFDAKINAVPADKAAILINAMTHGTAGESQQRMFRDLQLSDLLDRPREQLSQAQQDLLDRVQPLLKEPPPAPAPAPVAPISAPTAAEKPSGPKLTPSEQAWVSRYNKGNPDGAAVRLLDNLRDGGTPFQTNLANKLGLKALVDSRNLSPDQQAMLDRLHPQTKQGIEEDKNAVQERGAAPVDAREQAGPSAGVRGGDTEGGETPGPRPEEIPAQEPVQGAAEAPAPVQEASAPTAGTVEDRIREAFHKIAGQPARDNVRLSALRKELSDVPRADLDAALWSMRESKTAQLMNLDNPRDIKAEGDAALSNPNPGWTDKFHVLWIDPAVEVAQGVPAETTPPARVPGTLGLKEGKVAPVETPASLEQTADEKALAAKQVEDAQIQNVIQATGSTRAQELARMRAERPAEPAPTPAGKFNPASQAEKQAKIAAKTAVTEQGVFDLAGQGGDATAALAHIAEHGPSSTSRELAKELQDRVKAAGIQMPMTTGIDSAVPEGWSAASSWNKQTGLITLGRQDHSSEDLMHEVVHPLIYKAAEKNTQGWRELKGVFLKIAKGAGEEVANDPSLRYAFNAPLPEGVDPVKALSARTQEFASEAWSNPTLQAYLKAQAPKTWGKLQNAFFRMTGASDKVRSAFDDVMDVSRRVMDDAAALKLTDGSDPIPGHEPTVGSVPHALDTMNKLFPTLDEAKDWGEQRLAWLQNMRGTTAIDAAAARLHKWALGWRNDDMMVAQDGHYFPVDLPAWRDTKRDGNTIREREQGAGMPWSAERHAAAKANPKGSDIYDDILVNSNFYGYDPRKPLDQQPKEAGDTSAWSPAKMASYNSDRQRWGSIFKDFAKADDMQRVTGQQTLLTNGVGVLNELMRRLNPDQPVEGFHNPDGTLRDEIRDYVNHPNMMDIPTDKLEFMRAAMTAKLKGMEALSADYSARGLAEAEKVSALTNQADALAKAGDTKGAKALNDQAKELLALNGPDLKRLTDDAITLDSAVKTYRRVLNTDDQLPYSHFGRTGEHFVSMRLAMMPDGSINPEAQAYLQRRAVEEGFTGLVLDKNAENNMVFSRFKTQTQRIAFQKIGEELRAKGLLEPPPEPKAGDKPDLGYSLQGGMVNQAQADIVRGMSPNFVQRLMKDIDFSHLGPAERDAAQQQLRSVMMDLLPSDSLTHTQQHRENVLGFNKDMAASFQHYINAHAFSTSAMWQASRISDAMAGMAKRVDELKADTAHPYDADAAQRVLQEVVRRETRMPWRAVHGPMQTLLALNHAFYLTMSPVYTAELMTQIPVLMLPQLGRDYGYMAATKALAGATSDAFKVTRALLASGHGADALLTPDALRKVGLSPEKVDFVMRVANAGGLEIGGWTHAVMSDAPSIAKSRAMQAASVMTTASEVFPRALAALAAKSLHESDGGMKARTSSLDKYVSQSVSGSMFNWQTNMQARHLGVGGFAGPITPLVTKFMSYQTMLMNKLYTEADTAFGSLAAKESQARVERGEIKAEDLAKETKDARDSARRFLAGHLAAVATLGGSLGLPILPVAASAASLLANFLTGDDRYDAERWYRSHLQDAFGPVAAEAIAKGVPRLIGMDLSEHAGEERLLPFSDMLTDKRKWSDVFASGAFRALGSPFSMMGNLIKGGTDVYAGRTLKGMQELMPTFAKQPFRAFRMGIHGYEDESGHKLPIGDPSAADIAMQVVGITPAKTAAYDEATEALRGLQDRRQIISQNLGANMVTAFNQHDPAALRAAQQDTMNFIQTHPWMAGQIAAPIQHAVRSQAMGQAFGVNNINPRDQGAMRTLRAYGMP